MRLFLTLLFGAALLTSTPVAAADPTTHVEIQQAATSLAAGADRHDWDRVRGAMADEITTDYTSLFGGAPVTQAADDLVDGWMAFLPQFDATHHMVTNLTVTGVAGDTASAEADFTATHRLGDRLWVLGGQYSYELVRADGRWLVTSLTMTALWESGDRALLGEAAGGSADE